MVVNGAGAAGIACLELVKGVETHSLSIHVLAEQEGEGTSSIDSNICEKLLHSFILYLATATVFVVVEELL